MTHIGRLVGLAPAAHALAVAAAASLAITHASCAWAAAAALALYAAPPLLHRLHDARWPLRDSVTHLVHGGYPPWWGSYMLQWWFIAVPALEAPLHAVPGLYAAWLRCWGARVGRGVQFSPGLVVADRAMLDIGDGVVFGYGVRITSHAVKPTPDGGDLLCVLRAVRVGDRAFIGALCELGPGARVAAGEVLTTGARRLGGGR
ncbi:MAG TPA: acyl transferase [Myxococcota bacterium]|nr:acyl transferase [Myxococcota bacterium]